MSAPRKKTAVQDKQPPRPQASPAAETVANAKAVRKTTSRIESLAQVQQDELKKNRELISEITDVKLIENHTWNELNDHVKSASKQGDLAAFKTALGTLKRFHHTSQNLKFAYDVFGSNERAIKAWDKHLVELQEKPISAELSKLEAALELPRPKVDPRASVQLHPDDSAELDIEAAFLASQQSSHELKQTVAAQDRSHAYIKSKMLGDTTTSKQPVDKVKKVQGKLDAAKSDARKALAAVAKKGPQIDDMDARAELFEDFSDRFKRDKTDKELHDPSCCSLAYWSSFFSSANCCPSRFKPLDEDDPSITMEDIRGSSSPHYNQL